LLGQQEQLTWKDSPKLKQLVDHFVETHREGTSFGNTLLRRYMQNTKWVTNSRSDEEMNKFYLYLDFFKKYATQWPSQPWDKFAKRLIETVAPQTAMCKAQKSGRLRPCEKDDQANSSILQTPKRIHSPDVQGDLQ
jgi:hypothetical protein